MPQDGHGTEEHDAGEHVAGKHVAREHVAGGETDMSAPSARRAAAALAAGLLTAGVLTGCEAGGRTADAAASPPAAVTTAPTTAAPSPEPSTASATASASASASSAPPSAPPSSAPPSATPSSAAPTPDRAAEQPVVAPGTSGERVRELQARLQQLGHFTVGVTGYYGTVTRSSVAAFQRSRGLPGDGTVYSATWSALRAATRQPTRLETHPQTTNPLPAPDPRCTTGRVLCISKSARTLAWMSDGQVLMAMDVRFGSQYTPTRDGAFEVYWKSRDHHSTLYDSPMPFALFFSGGQAVHYSADFAANGYAGASHGCVNVRDRAKAAALFDQVRTGDKVVVYGP
ncbi:L,D-transpeptidase family protein [Streptomyces thermolineatus]|uniref:L,D-transpeptidase family protein n=1 Tax=Streptomyces thermolineatus TaxID=44033 RepID=UPI00384A4CC3